MVGRGVEEAVEAVDAVEPTGVLAVVIDEVGPDTTLSWNEMVWPSLKRTLTETGPGAWSVGTAI